MKTWTKVEFRQELEGEELEAIYRVARNQLLIRERSIYRDDPMARMDRGFVQSLINVYTKQRPGILCEQDVPVKMRME